MKKQSPQGLEWMIRRQRTVGRNQRSAAAVARHRSRRAKQSGRRRAPRPVPVVLSLPPLLNAERDETRVVILNAVGTMIERLLRGPARIKLDFSRVRRVYPGGMLLLLAYLEQLTDSFPGQIKAVCPRGSMSAQLLWHFGFGDKLRLPKDGNEPTHESVTGWKYATGDCADGAVVQEHIAGFESQVGSSMPGGLYSTLSESMTNVRHHAYPPHCDIPEPFRRWWMFSHCRSPRPDQEGNLYLAFYDIGIGIPASMRERLEGLDELSREAVDKLLHNMGFTQGKSQDPKLLQIAVEHQRSRTGLPFRGKGLPEMREFAASMSGGQMTIISGHGMYRFRSQWGKAVVTRSARAILGTLILWNLPLTWKEATP